MKSLPLSCWWERPKDSQNNASYRHYPRLPAGSGRNTAGTDVEASSLGTLTGSQSIVQAAAGKTHSIPLHSSKVFESQQCPAW